MGIITHLKKAKARAIIKSKINQRQKKAVLLKARLQRLYDTADINETQRKAIVALHLEYTTKQREVMEKYLQKEINIIEDLGGKYAI